MGLTPDPRERDAIQFFVLKRLPYPVRMTLVAVLLGLAFLLQLFVSAWPGWILMVLALVVGAHRGIQAVPTLKGEETWAQVTPDEYAKILAREKAWQRWDRDGFDLSNGLGIGVLVLFGGLSLAALAAMAALGAEGYLHIFIVNAVILVAPLWLIGIRTHMKRDELVIKIRLLEKVLEALVPVTVVQCLPMLATREAKEGGRVPSDARIMIRLVDAPEWFMGVQVQICLNNVQGTSYPYLYAVVLLKPEARRLDRAAQLAASTGARAVKVTVEPKPGGEVDVLVIRQKTSRTSGYHTGVPAALGIVQLAVNVAGKLCTPR